METLKDILKDDYESGTNRCSSLDLLITCYDEVNELKGGSK